MTGRTDGAVVIAITTWTTESGRSGLREWGTWSCSACHPITFDDPTRETRTSPYRLDRAYLSARSHATWMHDGNLADIVERPRP